MTNTKSTINWLPIGMLIVLLFYSGKSTAQNIEAERTEEAPKIDGILEEACWKKAAFKGKFFEYKPNNGDPSDFTTELYIRYDDKALYIAALLHDKEPDKIGTEFGLRDTEWKAADKFVLLLDTYNNGQNAFRFVVNASGVQADVEITNGRWDYNWNAVWKSAVGFNKKGWVVEMEIPYSAIRFPKKEVQNWNINFSRTVNRTSEESFWAFVDNSISGFIHQSGTIKGLSGIEPPLRLSALPYFSTGYTHDATSNTSAHAIGGGMDLKYGINESFTLDMSLIPDFSQVRSDNVVLNLSAFEVRNGENRPFFVEGTSIFNKGGLFYSRRVGQSTGAVATNDGESIQEYSKETSLVNALKLTGTTKSKTSIGVFNAITKRNHATLINDSTGVERSLLVDPTTNYNVLVLDQNLRNNSRVGIINTNLTEIGTGGYANVTGADYNIKDKENKYSVSGFAGFSKIKTNTDATTSIKEGYKYNLRAGKISGKLRYNIGRNVESLDYDINDMGYMRAANEISHWGNAGYHLFKPKFLFNNLSFNVSFNHEQLFDPQVLSRWGLSARFNTQFQNFWNLRASVSGTPKASFDYYEPRVEGRFITKPASTSYNFGLSTDGRKPVHLSVGNGFFRRKEWNQLSAWYNMSMRVRINNKASVNYRVNYSKDDNSIGYVAVDEEDALQHNLENKIVFGERDIKTTTTVVGANYTLNEKMGFNLNVRHYWSEVDYSDFYNLEESGSIEALDYAGKDTEGGKIHNTNLNALNIDMAYSWQFAPGSFINVVWKDSIFSQNKEINDGYINNLNKVLNQSQTNSVSIKITYYLDYLTIKNSI